MTIKNYLLVFLLLCTFKSFAGGFSAWQKETPYGHNLEHDGSAGGWVCMNVDTTTLCFQSFYFYKGYTIADSDSAYFIINETKENFQQFANEQTWRSAIKQQDLKPLITRSYNSDYSGFLSDEVTMFIMFFPVPLFFPLLWLCCAISLLFQWRWALGVRKHFSWIFPVFVFMVLVYNEFPQSI